MKTTFVFDSSISNYPRMPLSSAWTLKQRPLWIRKTIFFKNIKINQKTINQLYGISSWVFRNILYQLWKEAAIGQRLLWLIKYIRNYFEWKSERYSGCDHFIGYNSENLFCWFPSPVMYCQQILFNADFNFFSILNCVSSLVFAQYIQLVLKP